MPIDICKSCGKKTNTAYYYYWWNENKEDRFGCYARINEKDEWEKGCRYSKADNFMINYLKKIIGTSAKFNLKYQLDTLNNILNKQNKNVTRV